MFSREEDILDPRKVEEVMAAYRPGKGGEVFFLDMGEPVRILDLAENLIRLSGLEPGREVPIEVIGLRPGERLREELVLEQEDLLRTAHERVLMLRNHGFDAEGFRGQLEQLRALVAARDRAGAAEQLRAMAGAVAARESAGYPPEGSTGQR